MAGGLERDGPLDGPGSAVAGLPGTQDLLGVFHRDCAVAPARGCAIHEAIMNDAGLALMARMMSARRPQAASRSPGWRLAPALSC